MYFVKPHIALAGCVMRQQTTADEAHGEIGHIRPWFLPDDRHFLYVTRNRAQEDSSIFLATLDGPERTRLVGSRQAGAYASPAAGAKYGHLLFLRGGTLMAQPMDPQRFALGGDPVQTISSAASAVLNSRKRFTEFCLDASYCPGSGPARCFAVPVPLFSFFSSPGHQRPTDSSDEANFMHHGPNQSDEMDTRRNGGGQSGA